MKKLLLVASIGAIAMAWVIMTSCNRSKQPKYSDTATSGYISISVDESFRNIIQQEIDVFESIYVQAGVDPIYADEARAIDLLLKDSVRLAVTSRELTDQEVKVFENRHFTPRQNKLATDAIALIVNKQNKDTLITLDQIRGVLSGTITKWRQINLASPLGGLQIVFDHTHSSTIRYVVDSVLYGDSLRGNVYALKTNEAVIDYVAKTPDAIGVIGATWVGNNEDTTRLSFSSAVNVMAVSREQVATRANSYQPYQAYIALGYYPLVRNIYTLLTEPRSGLASGFMTFMTSDRGQRIILRAGIVPATQNVRIVNIHDNFN